MPVLTSPNFHPKIGQIISTNMINSNYFNMIINIFFNLHHHLVFLTQTESLFSLNIKCSIVNITELVQIYQTFFLQRKLKHLIQHFIQSKLAQMLVKLFDQWINITWIFFNRVMRSGIHNMQHSKEGSNQKLYIMTICQKK